MSISGPFSKKLKEGLEILINRLGDESANELEFRLGSFDTQGFVSGVTSLQFKNIIENLQRKYNLEEVSSLDILITNDSIGLKNIRTTISSLDEIRKYCLNEKIKSIDKNAVSYITKTKNIKPYDYVDYNLRGTLSIEKPIVDNELIDKINMALETQSNKKSYRYKHRYSFTKHGAPFRFDLTLTKTADGTTFKGSRVLGKHEVYEVEVEYIGHSLQKDSKADVILTDEFLGGIYDVLKWSQNGLAITTQSEREHIFNEYISLVFPQKLDINRKARDNREYFVSMNVLPLGIDKITPSYNQENYYIKDGYSVTDKADGEHHLLFVSGKPPYKGFIYLINNSMEIKHTGLQMNSALLHGSLFDGELVKSKNSKYSDGSTYMIFDCLFFGGRDIRNLPLYEIDSAIADITEIKNRYQAMIKTIEQLEITSLETGIILEIKKKKYLFHDPKVEKSIFELAKEIYSPGKYEYQLDGLIFTPYKDHYPKVMLGGFPIKWERLLKWKPIDQLSIDFLVEIVQKNGADVVKTDYDRIKGSSWNYKVVELKVQKMYRVKSHMEKHLVNFVPNKHIVDNLHVVKIKTDEHGTIRSDDGNIIYSGAIIEFTYKKENTTGYQWIPIRFRPDKTANKQPNSWTTANSTWNLINEPVTESMITGEATIDVATTGQQYYTQNSKALIELVAPLKKYHNAIKSRLIQGIAKALKKRHGSNYNIDLLDPCVGRGGDLYKWKEAEINYVLGIDIDITNLTKGNSSAYDRYREFKTKGYRYPSKVEFVWGDSSRRINTGAAGLDTDNKAHLIDIMAERGLASFDIVSCQFAIHYFHGSQQTIDEFLYNVSLNLKQGGYFVATTLNGKNVYDALKEKQSISGKKSDVLIWEIQREYDESEPFKLFGQKIKVYNVSIGNYITEYLVNFEHLVNTAKLFGMEPVTEGELQNLHGIQSFEKDYDTVSKTIRGKEKHYSEMGEDEKTYSFMNSYLIFKKTGSISDAIIAKGLNNEDILPLDTKQIEVPSDTKQIEAPVIKPVILKKKPTIDKKLMKQ